MVRVGYEPLPPVGLRSLPVDREAYVSHNREKRRQSNLELFLVLKQHPNRIFVVGGNLTPILNVRHANVLLICSFDGLVPPIEITHQSLALRMPLNIHPTIAASWKTPHHSSFHNTTLTARQSELFCNEIDTDICRTATSCRHCRYSSHSRDSLQELGNSSVAYNRERSNKLCTTSFV